MGDALGIGDWIIRRAGILGNAVQVAAADAVAALGVRATIGDAAVTHGADPSPVRRCWVVVTFAARVAAADVAPEDARRAADLFEQGRREMGERAFDAACESFSQSLALDPQLGTRLNLAACRIQQERLLDAHTQLELAIAARRPLFLHQRDAHAEFLPILKEHRPQLSRVVVHCFTDTAAALEDYLALDCSIGITGWICDERRGLGLRDASKRIPDDRLLVETDAPYLLPRTAPKVEHRRNEPMYLPYVVRALAQARGQSEAHVGAITSANAARFFGL